MSMELTTINPAEFDMQAVLTENGVTLSASDFVRIKTPSGGATSWEIPDGDDTTPMKFIEGVIVAKHSFRVYFEQEFNGQKQAPTCQSADMKSGVGSPGGSCATCPFNKWGSGKGGNGKACQEKLGIYFKVEDQPFPWMITLAPGSLASFNKYLTTLTMRGHLFYSIVTRFGLQKAVNKAGITFSQVTFTAIRKLTPDEFAEITPEKMFYTALVGQAIPADDTAQAQLPGAAPSDEWFAPNEAPAKPETQSNELTF